MKEKAFLVWKDGRRECIEFCGSIHYVKPWKDGERTKETTFTIDETTTEPGSDWLYREAKTKDITAQIREAAARRRREQGWPIWDLEMQGMLPGETSAEFERRCQVRKGELP